MDGALDGSVRSYHRRDNWTLDQLSAVKIRNAIFGRGRSVSQYSVVPCLWFASGTLLSSQLPSSGCYLDSFLRLIRILIRMPKSLYSIHSKCNHAELLAQINRYSRLTSLKLYLQGDIDEESMLGEISNSSDAACPYRSNGRL